LLVCSLAIGLACGTLYRVREYQPVKASTSGTQTNFQVTSPEGTAEATIQFANGLADSNMPFHWRELESSDLKRYVVTLRVVGCPPQTIRDIIVSALNRRFAPRLAAIKPPATPKAYWAKNRFESSPASHDPARERQLSDLDAEKQQLLAELLGTDATLAGGGELKESGPDPLAGYIEAGKLEAVRSLLNRFVSDRSELQQKLIQQKLNAQAESNIELMLLEAELSGLPHRQRAELATVLTPVELEEHDLRNSETARVLRLNLSGFNPSEQEFREIFREQQKLDEKFGMSEASGIPPTGADQNQYNAAKAELEARLKAMLGEERFANYQRFQNDEYKELVRAVDRFDLKPEVSDRIWSLRTTALA